MTQRWTYRPTPDARDPVLGRPPHLCQFSGCGRRVAGRFTWKHLDFDLCDRHSRGLALAE